MSEYRQAGSNAISTMLYIPKLNEPSYEEASNASGCGMLVGCSLNYSMPFFIDIDSSMNPHIFILGMSGGGKTFLMKNLLLRSNSTINADIVIIDFTGEYKEIAEMLHSEEDGSQGLRGLFSKTENKTAYIGLSKYPEEEKIRISSRLLEELVRIMRARKFDSQKIMFIVLDEAWKLLKSDKKLETIIREGRKYRVGLILASQLIEDAELPILANTATLFVFRMQNKKSLEKLSKNYGLSDDMLSSIQNLETGSCLVIRVRKSGLRNAFIIRKVLSVKIPQNIRVIIGENMIDVNESKMSGIIKKLAVKDPSPLISKISKEKSIELPNLIKGLILLEADRRAILLQIRKLGIDDREIADSFAFAIEEIAEEYG